MAEIDDLVGAAEDAVRYPILTKEVNGSGRSSRSGDGSGGAGGSLTRTAQGAIRDLLGWRYRADDPRGFLAALNKAVDLKEVEGHVSRPGRPARSWCRRTWAKSPEPRRAFTNGPAWPSTMRCRCWTCCGRCGPMPTIRAPSRCAPSFGRRSWKSSSELGRVSGPRIQRVNDYFRRLLGDGMNGFPPRFRTCLPTRRVWTENSAS